MPFVAARNDAAQNNDIHTMQKLFIYFTFLLLAVSKQADAEGFIAGIIPYSDEPRIGNNITVVTENRERFEGRAWFTDRTGFFCFSSSRTTCGGTYDARDTRAELPFAFRCLDGRAGTGVSQRELSADGQFIDAFTASGHFSSGTSFAATFGPLKEFPRGVGCIIDNGRLR